MHRLIRAAAAAAAIAALAGCATSGMMAPAPSQEIRPAAANKAQVVFMRTSFVGAAINAELFEVVNGELKFIGQLSTGTKIVYETTPGPKVFMAYGMAADYMLGNLAAGRTYYSIVRPNWGSGGMIPTPVRTDGTTEYHTSLPEFKKWVADTKAVQPNTAETQSWFAKEKDRYQKIHDQYWTQFQTKTDSQKAERTLRPQDGVGR